MKNKHASLNSTKHLARLVAVQALYQASFEEETLDEVLKRILLQADEHLNDEEDQEMRIDEQPDSELLERITTGVLIHKNALQEIINGALDERFVNKKMERLLHYIILAGVYELHHHADIDAKIIISDYIDVAKAFYSAKEPGLVNAVLDKASKALRS